MRIPLQLIVPSHTLKTVDSYVLIDSGTDISCIDYSFVKKHKLPVTKLEESIRSRNTDGSLNKKGDIQYSCTLFISIEGITQKILFHIMSLKDNVILGLPWLRATNLTINWTAQTLSIDESVDESKFLFASHEADYKQHNSFFRPPTRPPRHVNVDAITDSHLFEYNQWEEESAYINRAHENRALY